MSSALKIINYLFSKYKNNRYEDKKKSQYKYFSKLTLELLTEEFTLLADCKYCYMNHRLELEKIYKYFFKIYLEFRTESTESK